MRSDKHDFNLDLKSDTVVERIVIVVKLLTAFCHAGPSTWNALPDF